MGLVIPPFRELENRFSDYIGVNNSVSLINGTSALHLAFVGRDYKKGSEVIVPEFSMIATAWGPYNAGLVPIPVDCDESMNLDPFKIRDKITSRTVAILITHVYGRVCKVEPLLELCDRYNLELFEDCCEAHGAIYIDGPKKGSRVGSLGIGCFSFYKNKIISAEEGGAITIPDDLEYANHLQNLKNMAFGKSHNYIHAFMGFNYRMPDTQATLALKSLSKIEDTLRKRRQIESWYDECLPKEFIRPSRDVVWVYDINCKNPADLVARLNKEGIDARRSFAPMSIQPSLGNHRKHSKLTAFKLYENTCYLPVSNVMSKEDIIYICKKVLKRDNE